MTLDVTLSLLCAASCLIVTWWERRPVEELVPLGLVAAVGFGSGALVSVLWPSWVPQGLPFSATSLLAPAGVAPVMVFLWFWARWPRVETPLDAAWMGVLAGAGAGAGATLGMVATERYLPWLAPAVVAMGATVGSVWGLGRLVRRRLWLVAFILASLALCAGIGLLFAFSAQLAAPRWAFWILAGSLVLLAMATGMWGEVRLLGPVLREEVGFGLLPPWVGDLGPRFSRRFSRRWSPRGDERRAMVRLVVRLGACKAYLAAKGKHQSTATVELGRLRDRAKKLFHPQGLEVEF
ncbi:MAG: hypothetical protein NZ869_06285 [Thermoanaerobaculum sp.]|nr:hypothetical protein [Thermoanaerobaculum sp.]MDW7968374.1 hypothetical protein [Thermoanaerobaculum sp.]